MVFSQAWFEQHQSRLLRLLALPILGRLFRRALAIRPHDIGYRKPIVELTPHSYTVVNDDGTFTTDFRTHAKYGKRLYYAGLPLWKALHAWDMAIANPLVPALNAGFDTLPFYPDPGNGATTCDGYITRQTGDQTWASLIGGAGSFGGTTDTQQPLFNFNAGTASNTYDNMTRSMFTLDTSALPVNAVISLVTFSFYGTAKQDTFGVSPDVDVYSLAPAQNNNFTAPDYSAIGSTSYTGSPISYASWLTAAYNVFTLNATGRAAVSRTGITKLGCRNANYDVAGVAPTWTASAQSYVFGYAADQTGSSNDPKLEVTFALSESLPFAHLAAGNGMSIASQWRN